MLRASLQDWAGGNADAAEGVVGILDPPQDALGQRLPHLVQGEFDGGTVRDRGNKGFGVVKAADIQRGIQLERRGAERVCGAGDGVVPAHKGGGKVGHTGQLAVKIRHGVIFRGAGKIQQQLLRAVARGFLHGLVIPLPAFKEALAGVPVAGEGDAAVAFFQHMPCQPVGGGGVLHHHHIADHVIMKKRGSRVVGHQRQVEPGHMPVIVLVEQPGDNDAVRLVVRQREGKGKAALVLGKHHDKTDGAEILFQVPFHAFDDFRPEGPGERMGVA